MVNQLGKSEKSDACQYHTQNAVKNPRGRVAAPYHLPPKGRERPKGKTFSKGTRSDYPLWKVLQEPTAKRLFQRKPETSYIGKWRSRKGVKQLQILQSEGEEKKKGFWGWWHELSRLEVIMSCLREGRVPPIFGQTSMKRGRESCPRNCSKMQFIKGSHVGKTGQRERMVL